jgi:hypothetical protein
MVVGTLELYAAERFLVESVDQEAEPPVAVLRQGAQLGCAEHGPAGNHGKEPAEPDARKSCARSVGLTMPVAHRQRPPRR